MNFRLVLRFPRSKQPLAWFTPGGAFKRVLALTLLCVGAIPFVNNARIYAGEKVGLTYGVSQTVQAAYIWRGYYAGGPNTQIDANVGYGGAYVDMWWSLGAMDIMFRHFQPEVDISIGFKRWGLNIYALYIHNFNTNFFDFRNYADKGNRFELDLKYTISDKIPLTFTWATRVSAADGYINDKGDLVMAYSSYAEISYLQRMRDGFSLFYAFGITPFKSCYSNYQKDFAIQNVEVRLRKDWSLHERVGLAAFGQLAVNPCALINVITLNTGVCVYLK